MSDKNLYSFLNGPAYKLIFDAGVRREIVKLVGSSGGGIVSEASLAALQTAHPTGTADVIYITEDDNSTYRWNGSAYVSLTSGGSGGGAFTLLSGSVLTGNYKQINLTGNVALTTDTTTRAGTVFLFVQDATGSRTATLNGTSLPITSTANSRTFIILTQDASGDWMGAKDTSYFAIAATPIPDTTAPTLLSAEATNSHTIVPTFNETVSCTYLGYSATINGGSSITPDSGDQDGLVFSETFLSADIILLSYNAGTGNTEDTSGNPLASFTNQAVTNSVAPAGAQDLTFALVSNLLTNTSQVFTSTGSQPSFDTSKGVDAQYIEPGQDAVIYCDVASASPWFGLDSSATNNNVADWLFGVQPNGASTGMYTIASGTTSGGPGAVVGATGYSGIRVVGTVADVVKSADGITWTSLGNISGSRTVRLYPKMNIAGTRHLDHPKILFL